MNATRRLGMLPSTPQSANLGAAAVACFNGGTTVELRGSSGDLRRPLAHERDCGFDATRNNLCGPPRQRAAARIRAGRSMASAMGREGPGAQLQQRRLGASLGCRRTGGGHSRTTG